MPGDGTLSRFTRPCFLQWMVDVAETLFGKNVLEELKDAVTSLSLEVVGVLARPLYVCTSTPHAIKPEMLCMSTAAMSPLVQLAQARQHYRCAKCAKCEQTTTPVSDSGPPLRVLDLYVTVAGPNGAPTPVRMKPTRVVVEAPPDSFAWGKTPPAMEGEMQVGVPEMFEIGPCRTAYRFNAEESKAIWCTAKAFRSESNE